MIYKALYRRFRPLLFSDVIGQEHITNTLKNQIQSNKVAHAYLFSGGRGSGKTTTAKILARAVNCLNPQNGEPCNECEICKQALQGTLTDISEIDAASNNGVDNIRDIREEVEYVPTNSKYRVYIIDEVHMLSTGAFNALLKTLEEPPKHVIFILATTEPQKLPVTILSRCQRFDYRRISIENIIKRLKYICNEINVNPEENALKLIAKMAGGAMRDAISLLDRCTIDGENVITEKQVRELIGIPEFEYLSGMVDKIITHNIEGILELTEKIINEGKDLEFYLSELVKFVRDLVIYNLTGEGNSYNEEENKKLKQIIELTSTQELLNLIPKLSELQNSMKWSLDKEIIFETGILKIAMLKEDNKEEVNTNLSSAIMKMSSSVNVANTVNVSLNKLTNQDKEVNVVQKNFEDTSKISDLKIKVLTNLKENRKMIMHTILSSATFEKVDEDLVHIIFNKNIDDVNKQYMQKDESKMLIKEVIKNIENKEMKIKYVF